MYTVLSGAKANVGDFLITERSKALLRKFRPEHELFQLPYWEPLDDHLDQINAGTAIIIMGGPGYQPGFYPNVYKLTKHFDDIKVPIIPMGLGWKGFPGDFSTLDHYRFTDTSLAVLKTMSTRTRYFGCRDYLTLEALKRNGIESGLMTGCPVWYDIDSLNKEMTVLQKIEKLVFTPPHRPMFKNQSIDIMKMLAELFPDATRYCVFHRGITTNDAFKRSAHEKINPIIKTAAEGLDYKIVDAVADLSKIDFYKQCDLHVGYRMHGHLEFLSRRQPSILLHEDGRGRGVSQALNVRGIDGFKRNSFSHGVSTILPPSLLKVFDNAGSTIGLHPKAVQMLQTFIEEELTNGFARYRGLPQVIDAHFNIMTRFLESLP